MGMDQYLLIPLLDFDVNYRGTIGFDTLVKYMIIWNILNDGGSWMMMGCALWVFLKRLATWCRHDRPGSWPRGPRGVLGPLPAVRWVPASWQFWHIATSSTRSYRRRHISPLLTNTSPLPACSAAAVVWLDVFGGPDGQGTSVFPTS